MLTLCLLLILVSLAINLPLTWWLIGAGRRWGQMDQPGADVHKHHALAVPSTGGIGIFWAVMLPVIAATAAVHLLPESIYSGPLTAVAPHLAGLRAQTPIAVGVILAAVVFHVMGVIDDRRRLSPYLKLAVQVIVALLLAAFCDMRVLHLLDHYGTPGQAASIVVSVLWIVTITNAINFLDNMDGLSAGVSAIIAGIYLAATLMGGQWFVAAWCALLAGALLGFLVFNFPLRGGARLFMGDGGSLVVGLMLSVISIRTTYVDPHEATSGWHAIIMPLIVLAVPLYDITSVSLIRLTQGKSPFFPDQQHFSHRLVKKGLTKRTAVLVIWLCTLATGLGGVMLSHLLPWQAVLVAVQTAAVVGVLGMLERTK
jgi:UDP-GlcNAc:undecaprenyl-phosphate GlcNAc-1-phosphate transferase